MSKKTLYIISIIIILLGIGAWLWTQAPVTQAPSTGQAPQGAAETSDTTASINQDLQNIIVEDPNFQSIDSDVNSL